MKIQYRLQLVDVDGKYIDLFPSAGQVSGYLLYIYDPIIDWVAKKVRLLTG
ncbi:MAG: hypothetical protein VKL59_13835 [Nostocaceae cyanobacterium]|nr:hypothetical protein [Nostocaceae cyanobacterium]